MKSLFATYPISISYIVGKKLLGGGHVCQLQHFDTQDANAFIESNDKSNHINLIFIITFLGWGNAGEKQDHICLCLQLMAIRNWNIVCRQI